MSEFAKSLEAANGEGPYPSTKILIRGRTGVTGFYGPPSLSGVTEYTLQAEPAMSTQCILRLSPVFSPNGQLVCLVRDSQDAVLLKDTETGEIYREIPCKDAHSVEFSPLGTHLVTWSPRGSLKSESEVPNMKIWNIATGEVVASHIQKQNKKDTIQWTDDETYFFKLVTNEVQVFSGSAISEGVKNRIQCKGITQFKTR